MQVLGKLMKITLTQNRLKERTTFWVGAGRTVKSNINKRQMN